MRFFRQPFGLASRIRDKQIFINHRDVASRGPFNDVLPSGSRPVDIAIELPHPLHTSRIHLGISDKFDREFVPRLRSLAQSIHDLDPPI